MSFILLSSLLLALSSPLNAHGIVTKIVIGTKTYSGYHPDFQYRPTPPAVIGWTAPKTQDTGPVNSDQYSNPDIICHRGAKPGAISAPVAAGETVTLQWTAWPESHHGPMLDYLAPCNGNCSSVDKAQLKFFKIDGVGMTSTTGSSSGKPAQFADDIMIKNKNTWVVQIPSDIKAGNYVLRHETIALHEGFRNGGAQNYPQCINLEITGGGSASPDGVVGTSIYTPTEPGILFDLYKKYTSTSAYPIPGPPIYPGSAQNEYALNNIGGTAPPPVTVKTVKPVDDKPVDNKPVDKPVDKPAAVPVKETPTPVSTSTKNGKVCRRHARHF